MSSSILTERTKRSPSSLWGATDYTILMVGKFVAGIGVGYALMNAPLHIVEVSPIMSHCRKAYGMHATGPMSNQAQQET